MRGEIALGVVLCAAVAAAEPAAPERLQHADPTTLTDTYAPGAFEPSYTPPPPGSYELPVIRTVRDHSLLDADGKPTTLFAVTAGRVAVVAFVYLACVEAGGCPVSHAVLHGLDRALAADPALAKRVTLLTVSFDPDRDTTERMAEQRRLHAPRTDWAFLTTRGGAELDRLLADFDQTVAKLRYEDGVWSGLYRHVLKVFLLDGAHRVRAIYSTGFLDRALVLNDVNTLVAETTRSAAD